MPLYDFRCEASSRRFERSVKLADFEVPQECACGSPATRVISAPRFSVDNVAYDCPITGKWIGSKQEHEENLKQHGCRVYEPGETEQAKRLKAQADDEFERKLDETVEREIDQMPSEKKEKLANELLGGVDLAVERN